MHLIFSSPLRYTQGPDATKSLCTEMAILGIASPVLIVTSASPKRILESAWRTLLATAESSMALHDFAGKCIHAEIARIVTSARAVRATVILGAGGGKVIDSARAAAAHMLVPFISCHTIASTDSPCCANSVIYTDAGVAESVRFHPTNPALVLVDSQVIMHSPVRTLIAGMGDALSTVFEARACVASGSPNTRGGLCTLAALAIA